MKIRNKNIIYIIPIIILISSIVSITVVIINNRSYFNVYVEPVENVDFIIGVSQAQLRDPWQVSIIEEIKKESKNYDNIQVIYTDAAGSDEKQINDINNLMDYGIDLLIISPNDSNMISEKVSDVYKEMPVIVLDRGVQGYDYTLYIGPDNLMIGKEVGKYISEILGGNGGNVIEIKGSYDSNATNERTLGFRNEIQSNKNIKVIDEINVEWNRDMAEDKMYDLLESYSNIDVVFAHNDAMAVGAYNAYKNSNYSRPIKFIGIDGLQGENGGLESVENGVFSCTFTCPTGGKEAIQYAMDILNSQSGIPKKVILKSTKITKNNLKEYKDEQYKKLFIQEKEEPIVFGFCNVGNEGVWREANRLSIKNAAKDQGIELIYAETDLNQEKQKEIIRGFINMKVDIISFSPVVEDGWDDILREAKEANIPVIIADRLIKTEDKQLYSIFLGSDFREEGRKAARWVIDNMDINNKINVLEIQGSRGSTPAIERKIGFEEVISEYENINIISSKRGEYTFDEGKSRMKESLIELTRDGQEINLVYAHNDDMALGAIEAIKEFGLKPGKDIKIVSIDGIKEAIIAIKDGYLNCSVECNPLIGPQIMKLAKDIINGKDSPMMIITEETVFSDNEFNLEWLNRSY